VTAKLAIFDCDGTLVDSQANICLAMEHAFDEVGMTPPSRHATRRIVGLSLVEAMRVLLPEAKEDLHREMAERYKASYLILRNNGLEHEPLYDGIAALLSKMDEGGWLLGVATGKSDRGLERCLDHHGLKGLFVTLQTADRHPSKPHPAMVIRRWRMREQKPRMRWSSVTRSTISIWAVPQEHVQSASIGDIIGWKNCVKQERMP
jgi:phosphoglycolate phosphatase